MGLTHEEVTTRLVHIQQDYQSLMNQHRQALQGIKELEHKILRSQGAITEARHFEVQAQQRYAEEGGATPPEPDGKIVDLPPKE